MNLVSLLNNRNIEGIQETILKEILEGTHPSVGIKYSGNGLVVLTNNKVIKCVKNYYVNPNEHGKFGGSSELNASQCFNIQKYMGLVQPDEPLATILVNRCGVCHLACLRKKEEGKLKRKK